MHSKHVWRTGAVGWLRQVMARRRPERDDLRTACCNVFPPALAILVLVQAVERDGIKTVLALAIVLAVCGALAAALVWWPRTQLDDQAGHAPSAQENEASRTMGGAPAEAPAWWHVAPQAAPLVHDKPLEK